jgi:assimilatory nitrate reductase catalytic subunit
MSRFSSRYVSAGTVGSQDSVSGDPAHPANLGRLCSKGAALAETLNDSRRLLHPQIQGCDASWDAALSVIATRFQEAIAEHRPDSVAFYVSGQLTTEDYYVANKLMKGFIGSGNIDTNSRPMAMRMLEAIDICSISSTRAVLANGQA